MAKDFFGREITIGDQVVYPTMRSDTIIMRHAKVKIASEDSITVLPFKHKYRYTPDDTPIRALNIKKTENVVIVPPELTRNI
jgi:hypothetical protein